MFYFCKAPWSHKWSTVLQTTSRLFHGGGGGGLRLRELIVELLWFQSFPQNLPFQKWYPFVFRQYLPNYLEYNAHLLQESNTDITLEAYKVPNESGKPQSSNWANPDSSLHAFMDFQMKTMGFKGSTHMKLREKVWTFLRRFEPSWEGSSNRRNLLRRFMWIDPKLIFQYTESKWIVSSISHLIETYLYHFTNFARWCVYPVYYLSQIQIVWLSGFLDMLHFKKTDTDMLNLTTCQWSPGCHSRRFFGRSHCLACIF